MASASISDNGYDKWRGWLRNQRHHLTRPQSIAVGARLAAAGRVVRIVDASDVSPTSAGVAQLSIPGFDPAKDGVFDRQMVASTRDQSHNALSKLELREKEMTRLRARNAYLESELKLQERHLANALKDNIVLKKKLALKPARQR